MREHNHQNKSLMVSILIYIVSTQTNYIVINYLR